MHQALRCASFVLALTAVACSDRAPPPSDDQQVDAEQMDDTVPEPELIGEWEWVSFQGMDDSSLEIGVPSRYTLEIRSDGVSVLADCNRGTGSYELDGSSLTFTPLATTEMACPPESHEAAYLSHLSYVRSWVVEDGDLYLSLFADGGIMRFRAAGGSP